MMPWTPHVTVATIVKRDEKFLLVEEFINNKKVLNQPAGHVEANETLVNAAIRETLEETGWTVKPTELLGLYTYTTRCKTMTFYRTTFITEALHFDSEYQLDKDIIRTHWMTFEEIKNHKSSLRSPIVLKCAEDFCAGQRFPLSTIDEHFE
ncbi:MAG: NUDIX hydrolase [Pseudomonadales bacterium]|nr:NUDIX hydrolase [Pseudomonadales bacterium]